MLLVNALVAACQSALVAVTTLGAGEQAASAAAIEPNVLEAKALELIGMLPPGAPTSYAGTSESTGAYFLVIVGTREPTDGSVAALELEAREQIAKFLGVHVSSEESSELGSRIVEQAGEEVFEYFDEYSKRTTTEVEQLIAGQVLVALRRSKGACSAAYAVSEKNAEVTQDLARAMARRDEIGAVRGVGVAIDQGQGESALLKLAERRAVENAVRMVAGVSMTSSELRVNEEVVASAAREYSSGSIGSYTVESSSFEDGAARVEVLAQVEPEGLVKDVRKHLELLGVPRIAVTENATWPPGQGPAYSVSPFQKGFEALASELNLPLSAEDPEAADYLVSLMPEWRQLKHPLPGRPAKLKLYGQGELLDRATLSRRRFDFPEPERFSVNVDAVEAHQQLADWFWGQPANTEAIRTTLTEWLADFKANGRMVRVEFPQGFEGEHAALQTALERDGAIRNADLAVEGGTHTWTCRTQFSSGDLASRIQYHAAMSLGIELGVQDLQLTEIRFR